LTENLERLRKRGLGLAAVSYDSVAILKHFAERKKVAFPLLSDPDSSVIRAFGILNESVPGTSPFFGVPHPVTYIVNERGVIVSRHFEEDYRKRQTTGMILSDPITKGAPFSNDRLELTVSASDETVRGGERVRLFVDVALKPKMHVYAPGVQGYIPIQLKIDEAIPAAPQPPVFPASRNKRLKAIGETVPVYERRLRITADVLIGQPKDVERFLTADRTLDVTAKMRYQACDDRKCYLPEEIPLKWTFRYEPHDSTRVPEELRSKRLQ
jgi:hypothetical protein